MQKKNSCYRDPSEPLIDYILSHIWNLIVSNELQLEFTSCTIQCVLTIKGPTRVEIYISLNPIVQL